jgi:uncharacterized SAM-binding protein YcdF (DUF218 family)
MFTLQKIVARILFPLPIVFWLAAAAGVAAWRGRPRLARRLALAAVVWLFLISWNPLGDALLGTLERRHPPLEVAPPGITHIVVLGGGAYADETRHAAARLTRSSQGRVLEGVRLYHGVSAAPTSGAESPPVSIIFTGDSPDGRRSMASLAAETARDLEVPPERIVVLDNTWNTAQEAAAVREYLRAHVPDELPLVVLVTSASHMPRAVMLFRRAGLEPIPAPAQYLTDRGGRMVWSLLPESGALAKTETFVYEILGILRALLPG